MINSEGLKKLITDKVGTQLKCAEQSNIHFARLNKIIQGHLFPNAGELQTLKSILGPEVLSFFDNFDEISTVEEAETILAGLRKMLIDTELEGEKTDYVKSQISKVAKKLKGLKEAQEKEERETLEREKQVKTALQTKKSHEEARGHLRGRIAALKALTAMVKTFTDNLDDTLGRALAEEIKLTAQVDELAAQIPLNQGIDLPAQHGQLKKVQALIAKHDNELTAARGEYSRLELAGGSAERLAELKREMDHTFNILANFRDYEKVITTSIQELESDAFAAEQAALSIKAKAVEGEAEQWQSLQKSLAILVHKTDSVWPDIEDKVSRLTKSYAQVRGKGNLVNMDSLTHKGSLDMETVAQVGNWLFSSDPRDKLGAMASRQNRSDILRFEGARSSSSWSWQESIGFSVN